MAGSGCTSGELVWVRRLGGWETARGQWKVWVVYMGVGKRGGALDKHGDV